MQIEAYRERLEQFDESLNRELYYYYSGIKDRLETSGIYSEYSDLFTFERIREIETEIERAKKSCDSRKKSLARLRWFAVEHHLDSRVSSLSQEVSALEAQRTFDWDGREIAFVQIPLLLNQEASAVRRGQLNAMRISAMKAVESLKQERLAGLHTASVELGFKSYLDVCQSCTGISYAGLAAQLDSLMAATAAVYLERLSNSLQVTIGLSADEARHCDAWYWRWKNQAWHFFTQERLLAAVEETFSRLDLQPQRLGSISMDLEKRPLKSPRPFCVAIRVPTEIKIVLLPRGGYNDYAALLHESGHAHHFAWMSPSLPAEHRIWGDRGLSETYAYLFEYLLTDKEWLRETFALTPPDGLFRFQILYRAFLVRRYAGKLRTAIALYQGAVPCNAPETYAEFSRQCTGLRHDPELYLEDPTEGLHSADYLRAWIFEPMLRNHLRSKYGNAWYRNRSAGNFLKEIWETGQTYYADELCREIGLGALDAQVLQDEIIEGLRQ
jgi:hypothetical protein